MACCILNIPSLFPLGFYEQAVLLVRSCMMYKSQEMLLLIEQLLIVDILNPVGSSTSRDSFFYAFLEKTEYIIPSTELIKPSAFLVFYCHLSTSEMPYKNRRPYALVSSSV